jgi:hypothetical protein
VLEITRRIDGEGFWTESTPAAYFNTLFLA